MSRPNDGTSASSKRAREDDLPNDPRKQLKVNGLHELASLDGAQKALLSQVVKGVATLASAQLQLLENEQKLKGCTVALDKIRGYDEAFSNTSDLKIAIQKWQAKTDATYVHRNACETALSQSLQRLLLGFVSGTEQPRREPPRNEESPTKEEFRALRQRIDTLENAKNSPQDSDSRRIIGVETKLDNLQSLISDIATRQTALKIALEEKDTAKLTHQHEDELRELRGQAQSFKHENQALQAKCAELQDKSTEVYNTLATVQAAVSGNDGLTSKLETIRTVTEEHVRASGTAISNLGKQISQLSAARTSSPAEIDRHLIIELEKKLEETLKRADDFQDRLNVFGAAQNEFRQVLELKRQEPQQPVSRASTEQSQPQPPPASIAQQPHPTYARAVQSPQSAPQPQDRARAAYGMPNVQTQYPAMQQQMSNSPRELVDVHPSMTLPTQGSYPTQADHQQQNSDAAWDVLRDQFRQHSAMQQRIASTPPSMQRVFNPPPSMQQQMSNPPPGMQQQMSNPPPGVQQRMSNPPPGMQQQIPNPPPGMQQQISNPPPGMQQQIAMQQRMSNPPHGLATAQSPNMLQAHGPRLTQTNTPETNNQQHMNSPMALALRDKVRQIDVDVTQLRRTLEQHTIDLWDLKKVDLPDIKATATKAETAVARAMRKFMAREGVLQNAVMRLEDHTDLPRTDFESEDKEAMRRLNAAHQERAAERGSSTERTVRDFPWEDAAS